MLGKATHADERQGKTTYPALIGMEACRREVERLTTEAVAALDVFQDRTFLSELAWALTKSFEISCLEQAYMERIKIFDTTLRDGEQSPGCSMNTQEKAEVARYLERLGVDVIEAGFPASSPDDLKAVQHISGIVKNATVCALARCVKSDIDAAWEGVRAARAPRIHTFLATSPVHMEYKLKKQPAEVLDMIREGVSYAKTYCDDVEFSAEDATRSDRNFWPRHFL